MKRKWHWHKERSNNNNSSFSKPSYTEPEIIVPLHKRLGAELIGTFALVFAAVGSDMSDTLYGHALGKLAVTAAPGLVIMAMIYGLDRISGAYFNPAISIGFSISRHLKDLPLYTKLAFRARILCIPSVFDYPKHLMEKFGDRRWINVDDPDLLNYENVQVLLIGARKKDVEEELGIDIDEQKESEKSAVLFQELKMKKKQVPLKPLLKGKFPEKEEIPMAQEVKQLSKEEAPGRGGKIGGKAAATKAASAAAIAKLLSGIEFPKDKNKVIYYAEKNKKKVDDPEELINTIKDIPDRTYHNMVDIEKALGEIR